MKVYNCFQFYNELDILEIRLQENWETTDYFVISEADHTHSGKPKESLLLDNWEKYKPYADKIRHIQIKDSLEEQQKIFPRESDEWVREKFQRYALVRGLHDLSPEDLIVISDCDEVPRGEMIGMIKEDTNDYDRYILNIPHFHFRLNYLRIKPKVSFSNIMVVRGRAFTNPMLEREYTFPWHPDPPNTVYLEHGGWHWSDFGNAEHVINKMKSFCHLDQDNPTVINKISNLEQLIAEKKDRDPLSDESRFEYAIIDDYFPKCIYDNLERWNHMIIPNATVRVEDYYK
jgi:beta-1,4-mannosyl-glycoprotein beta-1,4-N-acetylglucosaminyltransferase